MKRWRDVALVHAISIFLVIVFVVRGRGRGGLVLLRNNHIKIRFGFLGWDWGRG